MLRILADENVPGPAIGCDASGRARCRVGMRGAARAGRSSGPKASASRRITFDKDFGELAYRAGAEASAGVVLFRITTRSPEEAADRILLELTTHANDLAGHFTVVSDTKVRIVKLPRAARGA